MRAGGSQGLLQDGCSGGGGERWGEETGGGTAGGMHAVGCLRFWSYWRGAGNDPQRWQESGLRIRKINMSRVGKGLRGPLGRKEEVRERAVSLHRGDEEGGVVSLQRSLRLLGGTGSADGPERQQRDE